MAKTGSHRTRRAGLGLSLVALAFAAAVPSAGAADRFVYVSNGFPAGTNNVSALRINANGSLTPVSGSPFATAGTITEGIAITPDAENVYVAHFGTNNVSGFNVTASGGLSAVAGSPFSTGFTNPLSLVPDPDNGHLFAGNHGSAIAVSTIAANGALSNIAGSPFALPLTRTNPFGGSAAPDGDHLYYPNENNTPASAPETVTAWSVAANGAVSPIQTIGSGNLAVQSNPFGSAITPDGNFLYVSNPEDGANGTITGFQVLANGTLSPLPGLQALNAAPGNHPLDMAISPAGDHLYVATRITNTVNAYNIAANGSLSAIPGQPFATGGTDGKALALTPDGKRLYVSNNGTDNVSGFNVAANGALSLTSGSPFPTGGTDPDLVSIAITPNQPPAASFAVQAGPAGEVTGFDASGSSDSDGSVATYDWDFGDGTVLADGGPIPNHIYDASGTYTATLTLTDNEGCSTTRIFTGKATLCNGSAVATTSRQVAVPNAQPSGQNESFARKLTISYSDKSGAFKGKLSSDRGACDKDQKVKVFEKHKGKDPKVGSDRSDDAGKWRVKERNAKGRFYAKAKQTTLSGGDTCLATKSHGVKVG